MNTQTSSPTRSLWTDEFLNPKRLVGDPLADDTIRAIMNDGLKTELDGLLKLLMQNKSFTDLSAQQFPGIRPELVKIINPYFTESGNIPAYQDEKLRDNHRYQLNSAADAFEDQLVPILLTLHCKSLPLSYACANGAKVLHQAGRMVVRDQAQQPSLKPFTRRLVETAQFVNNLLAKNGFEPEGNAIINVQKVRLMHAAIRYYTKLRPWDVDRHGEPINQEDLALGHLIFSSVIISGLRTFGIDVSTLQEGYYLYLWRTVAHILGIQPELVPQNQTDGEYLLKRIMDRQAAPSQEGTELTYACIEFIDGKLQWSPIKRVAPRLMRFLLGDTYARILLIPGTPEPGQEANAADFGLISTLFPKWDTAKENNLLFKWIGRLTLSSGFDEGLKAYNAPPKDQFFVPSSLSDYLDQKNPVLVQAGPPVQTLPEAISRLSTLATQLKNNDNPLGLFAVACRELAKAVLHRNSTGKFTNHDLVESVYRQTINRFFTEVNHASTGEALSGPWARVFLLETQRLTIDQHLLLAGYTHLAYDLIIEIAAQVPADKLAGFETDYRRILDLFTQTYIELIEQLGREHRDYGWLAGLFYEPARDALFDTFKTEVGEAWLFTTGLTKLAVDSEVVRQHNQKIATVADQLTNPTSSKAYWLKKLARQQFPSDEPDQSAATKINALLDHNFS
jgi:hypothetical protein